MPAVTTDSYQTVLQRLRGSQDLRQAPGLFLKIFRLISKIRSPSLTLCGPKALDFVIQAMNEILDNSVPGDFIEAGVWRGGVPLLMRAHLQHRGITDRKVWLADSFQGLPARENLQMARDKVAATAAQWINQLQVSQQQVEEIFNQYDLNDQQVQFLPGWFSESLPQIQSETQFALIRLDGDYYESTKDCLEYLYPRLSPRGFLIVDDYNLPLGCKRAVDEYRSQWNITSPLIAINSQSVYWRKESH